MKCTKMLESVLIGRNELPNEIFQYIDMGSYCPFTDIQLLFNCLPSAELGVVLVSCNAERLRELIHSLQHEFVSFCMYKCLKCLHSLVGPSVLYRF